MSSCAVLYQETLWPELLGIREVSWIAVQGEGNDQGIHSFRNFKAIDVTVVAYGAREHGHGGEEAKGLLDDAFKVT